MPWSPIARSAASPARRCPARSEDHGHGPRRPPLPLHRGGRLLLGGLLRPLHRVYLTTRHHLHYLAIPILANLGCAIATYPLQRRWVFRATGPALPGFLRFYAICIWAMVFTYAGLPILVELAHVPVLLAQALLIVTAP